MQSLPAIELPTIAIHQMNHIQTLTILYREHITSFNQFRTLAIDIRHEVRIAIQAMAVAHS